MHYTFTWRRCNQHPPHPESPHALVLKTHKKAHAVIRILVESMEKDKREEERRR